MIRDQLVYIDCDITKVSGLPSLTVELETARTKDTTYLYSEIDPENVGHLDDMFLSQKFPKQKGHNIQGEARGLTLGAVASGQKMCLKAPNDWVTWMLAFLRTVRPYLPPDFEYSTVTVSNNGDHLTSEVDAIENVALIGFGSYEGGE